MTTFRQTEDGRFELVSTHHIPGRGPTREQRASSLAHMLAQALDAPKPGYERLRRLAVLDSLPNMDAAAWRLVGCYLAEELQQQRERDGLPKDREHCFGVETGVSRDGAGSLVVPARVPPTDEQLAQWERLASKHAPFIFGDEVDSLLGDAVPALVAEVRRLRGP